MSRSVAALLTSFETDSLNNRKRKETTRITIRRFIKSRSMDRQADISQRARGYCAENTPSLPASSISGFADDGNDSKLALLVRHFSSLLFERERERELLIILGARGGIRSKDIGMNKTRASIKG